jgi:hypothetical protein
MLGILGKNNVFGALALKLKLNRSKTNSLMEVINLAGNTLRTPPQPYPKVSKSLQDFKTGREELI